MGTISYSLLPCHINTVPLLLCHPVFVAKILEKKWSESCVVWHWPSVANIYI
jgi:hypothetical protein